MMILIYKRLLRCCLPFYRLIALIALIASTQTQALTYQKVEVLDEQFLLLDVNYKKLRLLESVTAYKVDEQVLLPISSIFSILELDYNVSTIDSVVTLTIDNKTTTIYLLQQIENGYISSNKHHKKQDVYWAKDEGELFVSHWLIEALTDSELLLNMSRLTIEIIQNKTLFPLEKRLAREERRKDTLQQNNIKNNSETNVVFGDEYILDTYQLFSSPSAYINLNLLSSEAINSDIETRSRASLQSNFDFLYHYVQLTINKKIDNNIASNLTFTRHQASPYESFPLGIKQYSFGDVFAKSNNISLGNQAGVGITVSKRPLNHSRNFGKYTIEDMAPPGWDIELYRGGVLLQTATVPDDGRYVFEDIKTLYGVNKFQIKIYGPYGEEIIHHKIIQIDSTQLKKQQYGFDGYILDAGNKLLNTNGQNTSTFKPDTFGFSYDYGLNDDFTLGFNLSQTEKESNEIQIIGAELTRSIPGALFNVSLAHQLEAGYASHLSVIGQLGNGYTYQIYYSKNRDFQTKNTGINQESIEVSLSANIFDIYSANQVSFKTNEQTDTLDFTNRLSKNLGLINLTHYLNYRKESPNKLNTPSTSFFTGNINIAGRLSPTIRIAGGLIYNLKKNAEINSLYFNNHWSLSDQISLHNRVEYLPQSKTHWRLENSLVWHTSKAFFNSSFSYDALNQWSVGLGVSFSVGFDNNNNDWIISNKNIGNSGTLDINSYLDLNNNQRLDAGDVALPNVSYTPSAEWQDIRSNAHGKATLPFVNTFAPTRFRASWNDGVYPSTNSYTVFTHPGSHITAEIPFVVTTTVTGFVLFNDINGKPFTGAKVQIKNNNNLIDEVTTDEDGFFEFEELDPNAYTINIKDKALSSRNLKSDPESLAFTTPPAGGYFELGIITAVPLGQENISTIRTVLPTSDNYEAILEVEQLLNIKTLEKVTVIKNKILSPLRTTKVLEENIQPQRNLKFLSQGAEQTLKTTRSLKNLTAKLENKKIKATQWIVQVSALSTKDLPDDFIVKMQSANVKTTSYFDANINMYRIIAGQFDSKEQAQLYSDKLQLKGIHTLVKYLSISKDINKLKAMDKIALNGFTIQLIAADNKSTIDAIMSDISTKQNHDKVDKNEFYQLTQETQNTVRYLLLKGHYSTRIQAENAVQLLIEPWKSNTWIRKTEDLRTK
ncbi:carboxypeptidase regulatory-like domain-containing protein [Colwellia sp. TT2012]|uniref:carboxypeptidase regulatory-like domain-containing protein n=1 Tax=Colwellia sp. TT2012 TaxID=1720342 RepID=UPI000711169A|nr:carboxypeptidase regulatory-like domain-containing protein [Colwellia sp. TT2012]